MSYEPQPGTVAYRAIAWLEKSGLDEVNLSGWATGSCIPVETLGPCLEPALRAGIVAKFGKGPGGTRPIFYRLASRGAAAIEGDDSERRPAAVPMKDRAALNAQLAAVQRKIEQKKDPEMVDAAAVVPVDQVEPQPVAPAPTVPVSPPPAQAAISEGITVVSENVPTTAADTDPPLIEDIAFWQSGRMSLVVRGEIVTFGAADALRLYRALGERMGVQAG